MALWWKEPLPRLWAGSVRAVEFARSLSGGRTLLQPLNLLGFSSLASFSSIHFLTHLSSSPSPSLPRLLFLSTQHSSHKQGANVIGTSGPPLSESEGHCIVGLFVSYRWLNLFSTGPEPGWRQDYEINIKMQSSHEEIHTKYKHDNKKEKKKRNVHKNKKNLTQRSQTKQKNYKMTTSDHKIDKQP